jgi:hypothetical protein
MRGQRFGRPSTFYRCFGRSSSSCESPLGSISIILCLAKDLLNSRVDKTLDDGHPSLGELLLGVSTSGVSYTHKHNPSALHPDSLSTVRLLFILSLEPRLTQVDGVLDVDVVDQGDVLDFDTAMQERGQE